MREHEQAQAQRIAGAPALDSNADEERFPCSSDGTPLFCQSDPRWGGRILGNDDTLASAGCAMTATAMALSKINGHVITPRKLDRYLDEHAGYDGDALRWAVAASAVGLNAEKVAWNLDTINAEVDAGRPVVVGIDSRPGSAGGQDGTDHWVAVTARRNTTYDANDPRDGHVIELNANSNQLSGPRNYKSTGQLVKFF
jgi:hypothetical protein